MTLRRATNRLVVHCAATKPSQDIGAAEIRQWHIEQRGWVDIGYHYVIRRSGVVEPGRPIADVGAHFEGYNRDSVGICLVGGVDESGRPLALFVNDYEFALIQKMTGMNADEMINHMGGGLDGFIVVTRGEQDTWIFTREARLDIPVVKPERIIDPTGVGDAFRGGFLTGYVHKLDLETCGRMGALAATTAWSSGVHRVTATNRPSL